MRMIFLTSFQTNKSVKWQRLLGQGKLDMLVGLKLVNILELDKIFFPVKFPHFEAHSGKFSSFKRSISWRRMVTGGTFLCPS